MTRDIPSLVLRCVGVLAAASALLTTTACQQEPERLSAGDVALAYLEAIASGDAAAANALATAEGEYGPRPADDSLAGAVTIADVAVGEVPDPGNVPSATVPVSYALAGQPREAELSLRLVDGSWLVAEGLDSRFVVRWAGFTDVLGPWSDLAEARIGSTPVGPAPGGGSGPGVLYPGVYEVSTDLGPDGDLGPYGELVTETVVAEPGEQRWADVELEIEVAPSERLIAEVAGAFDAELGAIVERAGDGVPSLYPGDAAGDETLLRVRALEADGAVFAWSVVEPAEVTWTPGDGVTVVGTAAIRADWTASSGSGEIVVPLRTSVRAVPTTDSLDVSTILWHYDG